MRSICLKVPRGEAESCRKKLLEEGLLDLRLRIKRDGDFVLIPVTSEKAGELGYEVAAEELEGQEVQETDYRKQVDLPDELRALLPTSFDVIGDVAIIRLEDELVGHAHEIGRALQSTFPRLRTVALDKGVKGELRVRDLEVIAGEDKTETVHIEYGVRLLVDPVKVYFNPRLANERRRIASLVKDGERVVDMFAGVGPFAIMIAKHARPRMVIAMDLNHDAVEYMKMNIALNKVSSIVPMEGDSGALIHDLPCADRIIMNLPHTARSFLADALTNLEVGGTIHLYMISERDEVVKAVASMVAEASGMGLRVAVDRLEELKTYSPSMSVYSIDVRLVEC